MAGDISFRRIVGSRSFLFIVGSARKRFLVHASLIAHHSDPLAKLMRESMSHASISTVTLEDVDEDTFVRFSEYAYTKDYRDDEPECIKEESVEKNDGFEIETDNEHGEETPENASLEGSVELVHEPELFDETSNGTPIESGVELVDEQTCWSEPVQATPEETPAEYLPEAAEEPAQDTPEDAPVECIAEAVEEPAFDPDLPKEETRAIPKFDFRPIFTSQSKRNKKKNRRHWGYGWDLEEEPQPVVEEPQPVVEEPQPVVEEPQPVVEEPPPVEVFVATPLPKRTELWAKMMFNEGFEPSYEQEPISTDVHQDWMAAFLANVKVYTFADTYEVGSLKELALKKLRQKLIEFPLYQDQVDNIVDLLRYVYQRPGLCSLRDGLKDLVMLYAVCILEHLETNARFQELLEKNPGAISRDLIHYVIRRLD